MNLLISLFLVISAQAESIQDLHVSMLKGQWSQAFEQSVELALQSPRKSEIEVITRLTQQIPREFQSHFHFTDAFSQIETGMSMQLSRSEGRYEMRWFFAGQKKPGIQIKGLLVKGLNYFTPLLQLKDCKEQNDSLLCESKPWSQILPGPGLYMIEIQTASEKTVDYFFMTEPFVYPDRFAIKEPNGFKKLSTTKIAYEILGFEKNNAEAYSALTLSLSRPGPSFNGPVKEWRFTGKDFSPSGTVTAPGEGAFDFEFTWIRRSDLGPLKVAFKGYLSQYVMILSTQK